MFTRIWHIVIKEFIQLFRDRRMRFFLVVPPVAQLLVFGYVVTLDVERIPTALQDLDRSADSRELARNIEASGYFMITARPEHDRDVTDLLDRGRVLCAVRIAPGFQKDLRAGHPVSVQLLLDGTDSNTALIAMGYLERVVGRFSAGTAGPGAGGGRSLVDLRTRAWYNPELRSRYYNVPGVIASILMLICLMMTAMAIVREREVGTMEQLMVTPIRPVELILGKTIPFALIGFVDMVLITAVGVNWFGVPIRGSLALLLSATGVYILSALGIGLFISTVAKTQQQALMATMLFYMPAILLSGFAFPIENMPQVFQQLTYLNPLRYYLIIIRGIFLKGIGFDILWTQMAPLLLIGVIVLTLSALRFRKRLN